MKYSLSQKRPDAVVGKALPLRNKITKGTKATRRPKPYLTNKASVLPTMMHTCTKRRLRPVNL